MLLALPLCARAGGGVELAGGGRLRWRAGGGVRARSGDGHYGELVPQPHAPSLHARPAAGGGADLRGRGGRGGFG